ncbi:MAG: dethiobiotin synthase [Pseudobutyrivibrio sp.]|nr:dethiobiotin synthase [Pseudobutyrivibrio sp.]
MSICSGGIICPIRYDNEKVLLKDVVKMLGLSVLIVADAGLGTINDVVTTVSYILTEGIEIKGIILNKYTGDFMQRDNIYMIEELMGIKVRRNLA